MGTRNTWSRSYEDVDGRNHIVLNHGEDKYFSIEADRDSHVDRQISNIALRMSAKDRNIELLETALTDLSEQSEPLKAFARAWVESMLYSGGGVVGHVIAMQEQMIKLGLLTSHVFEDEADIQHYLGQYDFGDIGSDFAVGDTCYLLADWLQEPEAPKPTSDKLMQVSAADTAIRKAEQQGEFQ